MKASARIGLSCILGMMLCGSAYEVYSQNTPDQNICLNIHSDDAILAVKDDLLFKPHTEMSNENPINNGALVFHMDNLKKEHSRFIVPFTLTSHKDQSEFQAVVKCSDLHSIEYDKL